jgi:RNA-directed DNA polymerase
MSPVCGSNRSRKPRKWRSSGRATAWWALSHAHAVDQGLRNAYFAKRGLLSVVGLHRRAHQHIAAPVSPQLALWG